MKMVSPIGYVFGTFNNIPQHPPKPRFLSCQQFALDAQGYLLVEILRTTHYKKLALLGCLDVVLCYGK